MNATDNELCITLQAGHIEVLSGWSRQGGVGTAVWDSSIETFLEFKSGDGEAVTRGGEAARCEGLRDGKRERNTEENRR